MIKETNDRQCMCSIDYSTVSLPYKDIEMKPTLSENYSSFAHQSCL